MPLLVRVDATRGLIFVKGQGIVTDQELTDYVGEYLDRRGLKELDELFDLTEADLEDVTLPGLAKVAEAAAATDSEAVPTRIAILVSESTGMGISRMYQVLREDKGGQRRIRLFSDRSECFEWLDLPLDPGSKDG